MSGVSIAFGWVGSKKEQSTFDCKYMYVREKSPRSLSHIVCFFDRFRYVHQNCVQSLLGLEGKLDILDTLNISNNNLTTLEGLACCPLLSTLLVTHNQLMTAEGLAELVRLPNLHTLDMQNNMITEPDALKVCVGHLS